MGLFDDERVMKAAQLKIGVTRRQRRRLGDLATEAKPGITDGVVGRATLYVGLNQVSEPRIERPTVAAADSVETE